MKMRGASVILRRFVGRRAPCLAARSSSIGDLIVSSAAAAASYSTLILAEDARPLFVSAVASGAVSAFHPFFMNQSRNFSSAPSPDSSKVVSIESEEQFNDSVRKAEEESQPSIFYFTAAWCGPCRLLSPMIGQLSEKYPHVTTYKIDIDKKGLENAVSKSNIHSVPTLHFFQNGKKAGEVIGADVERLKDTMEALYK
ncbi:thioredoxin O2, mitochondrial-like [Salvia miltiorrhiza]|uniref:thioredoxin O2, mitochondrial-like n=1 Tax=Salvia miltiorrhiza TaxID=226208 RepID=UPI0025AC140E|nr:thioredoxin O2, mitochondrial-like [Salvia miltiorrhiza]